jgi:O-antigen/teichoic acid export membrane protein
MGISNAIIARQTSERSVLSTLYWTNLAAGATVSLVIVAVTPLVEAIYGQRELLYLVPLAATIFLIAPLGQQFQVLLERDLRFDVLARMEIVAAIGGTCVAIVAAAIGAGAASLLLGVIATTTIRAAFLVTHGWRAWRPELLFRRRDLRGYLGFGLYQMAERSLSYMGQNIDYLLIGGFMGPAPLGAYSIAYQLVVVPQTQINPILTRIAFPVFAKRQNDVAALRRGFLEVTRLLSFVSFPAMVGLAVVAPHLVPIVFGEKWHQAVPLIQILSILGASKATGNPIGALVLAKNRPDIGFFTTIVQLLAVCVGLLVGVQYGVVGASWGHVIAVLLTFGVIRMIVRRLLSLSLMTYFAALRRPAELAVAMGVIVVGASFVLDRVVTSQGLLLTLQIMIGVVVYCTLLMWFEGQYIFSLWRLLRPPQSPLETAAPPHEPGHQTLSRPKKSP